MAGRLSSRYLAVFLSAILVIMTRPKMTADKIKEIKLLHFQEVLICNKKN